MLSVPDRVWSIGGCTGKQWGQSALPYHLFLMECGEIKVGSNRNGQACTGFRCWTNISHVEDAGGQVTSVACILLLEIPAFPTDCPAEGDMEQFRMEPSG